MLISKKMAMILILLGMMIQMSSAQAKLLSTDEALQSIDRTQIVLTTEREDVQQQLIQLGVDPVDAKERVNQITDTEISQINGRLEELPAGAGISTVDLLLIIIIILLI